MNNDTIEVHFTHPRDSSMNLTADISPQCTGQEALQELMHDEGETGPFLQPLQEGNYVLSIRRSKQAIPPSMTFAQAGVIDGDTIVVGQDMTGAAGARPPAWLEIDL